MSGEQVEVVIVGAGPVGTLLAAELARRGVETVTLEARTDAGVSPAARTRAVGVHATALTAMEGSGATDRLLAGARRVRVGEARRRGRTLGLVRFDRLHSRHPYVATLPQPATEAALAATAAAWGAAAPRRGSPVARLTARADGVEVHLDDGTTIAARIAVVAGGLRSRALLPGGLRVGLRVGRGASARAYPDRYLMTDTEDRGTDGDVAVVHLDPDGVLESFPLPAEDGRERRRYVAWMPAPAVGEGGQVGEHGEGGAARGATDAARLRAAIATRTGSEAAASAVDTATGFAVARSRLARMRAGRVIAIGDAAHEVSPIGGQGMNLGLLDAVTLAPLLARWLRADRGTGVRGEAPPALDLWERERLRAADRSGRIAAANTVLGRPSGPVGAWAVGTLLSTPAAALLAHAYAMGFDPAARRFRSPR